MSAVAPAGRGERAALAPAEARALFREGLVTPTSGWCDGWAQANLIVVPRDWAFDVLLFAQRNPKPCPVLGVLEPGEVSGTLLRGGDVRTDVPLYTVYENGEAAGTRTDLLDVWRAVATESYRDGEWQWSPGERRSSISDAQQLLCIEERQIAPLVARVNTLMSTVDGILGDVKGMTSRVTRRTERVDAAIDDTIHRVDETAGRVRAPHTPGTPDDPTIWGGAITPPLTSNRIASSTVSGSSINDFRGTTIT